jgi:5'(3')-deoxyribonucleotidase
MNKHKKRILIDLDGVLNTYDGNYDTTTIPPIKKGAKAFVKELSKNFELYIFTSRNLLLSAKWLIENNIDSYFCDITNTKLPSHIYIDDRAINFNGSYKTTLNEIDKFQAYWAKTN